MQPILLTGTKRQILESLERIDAPIARVLVFLEPPAESIEEDIFAEMEPYTVHVSDVDDSREAIYTDDREM